MMLLILLGLSIAPGWDTIPAFDVHSCLISICLVSISDWSATKLGLKLAKYISSHIFLSFSVISCRTVKYSDTHAEGSIKKAYPKYSSADSGVCISQSWP
jgi:hypothetical protein